MKLSLQTAKVLATHTHYKGGLYRVIGEALHTETGEPLVIYEHLWPYEQSLYARPLGRFYDEHVPGKLRFAPGYVRERVEYIIERIAQQQ